MRHIVELHIRCSDCGSNLLVKYDNELDNKKFKQKSTRGGETGGYKVEQSIFVAPCETCLKPAKEVIKAVKLLNSIEEI